MPGFVKIFKIDPPVRYFMFLLEGRTIVTDPDRGLSSSVIIACIDPIDLLWNVCETSSCKTLVVMRGQVGAG